MMVESGVGPVAIIDPRTRRVVGIISRQDLLKVRSSQKRVESARSRGTKSPPIGSRQSR